jgi:L-ascorbate metabolism protein UlaG (beta-lactamase superfamily)
MKTTASLLISFLLISFISNAQLAPPDQIAVGKVSISIQPVEHASLVLTYDGVTIYIDPSGDANLYSKFPAPDLIMITDIHGDHMDLKVLDKIDISNTKFIMPAAVEAKLPEKFKTMFAVMNNGDKTEHDGIAIEAVPMYNLPEEPESRHPKGRGNGYILTFGDKRLYISGDTEDIDEMKELKNIDIAFVCMNLTYTMDVKQAASAVLKFKPAIVYPYHYRGQDGLSDVELFKKLVNDEDKKIEVRLRDWYPGQ